MYARELKCRNQKWGNLFQSSRYHLSHKPNVHCSKSVSGTSTLQVKSNNKFTRIFLLGNFSPCSVKGLPLSFGNSFESSTSRQLRCYSSKGDGSNASENKQLPVEDGAESNKRKKIIGEVGEDLWKYEDHVLLGEREQKEWLNNERLSIESRKRESPFLSKKQKFKNEFIRRFIPWEKITVSWEAFPYYIHENTKRLLVECAASHLKNKKFTSMYGCRLNSSSERILLQSVPGTELYRERLVRALARDMQVPLLVLDSSVLAPLDLSEDCSENEYEDEDAVTSEECSSESEAEDSNDASNEEWTRSDATDDEELEARAADALKKLIPGKIEELEKTAPFRTLRGPDRAFLATLESGRFSLWTLHGTRQGFSLPDLIKHQVALSQVVPSASSGHLRRAPNVKQVSGDSKSSSGTKEPEDAEGSEKPKRPVRKGDLVKYIGPTVHVEADNRINLGTVPTSDGPVSAYTVIQGRLQTNVFSSSVRELCNGQRGVVFEVNGDLVAVVIEASGNVNNDTEKDTKVEEEANPSLYWIRVEDVELDLDAQAEDCYVAVEALCEVLKSKQPLIVYFPDSNQWLSRAVPKSNHREFVSKIQEMFDQLSGPVVLICGQNKVEMGTKEKEKFTMIFPTPRQFANMPLPLRRLALGLKGSSGRSDENDVSKLFTNTISVHLPKEEDLLSTFHKQIEEDRKIVISRNNLTELHKVLEEHELSCLDLLHVNTDGVILTNQKAKKVVGWARNHYLSSCICPLIKGGRLNIPRDSIEVAVLRLKEQETFTSKLSQNLKNLAKDEYESNFISAVVPPGEIGVRFDDIGALEDVKKALYEIVILPMRRPELFSHGNLLRPCKGILLFGPPGTGKTLLAKAIATEAGANFISITGSTMTSKWFGDAEKLTKALFSFASKLAPVIIFVDEVDSLLGARGGSYEHEATRRMRNEFMAAWDGLRSKDNQRILILGATNRPFDLDDAVIRRLPRSIFLVKHLIDIHGAPGSQAIVTLWIYVDLPDAENRMKILQVLLAHENLETGFQFDQLANKTEGYSGSDLKNLCIAAAYRPVQELLEKEKKAAENEVSSVLRPLNLDDFIQSKAKVSPSVSFDATSMNELRKWNEQYGEGGSRKKSPFGFDFGK
ncbi:Outer mitochondrial transmembrane helix translocase-like protein [Drosera capensis]